MIDFIDRDFTISAEKQKKQIIKEYKKEGKEVLFIQSIMSGKNRGKIQIMYKIAYE